VSAPRFAPLSIHPNRKETSERFAG